MVYATNDRFAANFCAAGKSGPPPLLGIRYEAGGRFLPQPGNTVVCAVEPGSPTELALAAVRRGFEALPHGGRFAYTPPASWHLTVIQGPIERRRERAYWPAGLPLDTPIPETTEWLGKRLEGFRWNRPFRMRIVDVTPLGVVVAGRSEEDEASIRAMREALTAPLDCRFPDHDGYVFHITLAYIAAWLPDGAERLYLPELRRLADRFAASVDTLDLGPPAFCVFDDMTEFRPLLWLASLVLSGRRFAPIAPASASRYVGLQQAENTVP